MIIGCGQEQIFHYLWIHNGRLDNGFCSVIRLTGLGLLQRKVLFDLQSNADDKNRKHKPK